MIELPTVSAEQTKKRKPNWLRVKLPVGSEYAKVRRLVDEYKLHTICESGNCASISGLYLSLLWL
jgi:lipoic acid synthetase